MRCLGIDVGSTSIKGALLDCELGAVSHVVKAAFPEAVSGLPPGFHEVRPAEIVAVTSQVIAELLERAPDVERLFVSSQMGGVMLLDQTFAPLTNYLSWRDQRTTIAGNGLRPLDALRACWTDCRFTELGKELKPGSATALLHWLVQHQQLPANAIPVTVGDFIISQLCDAPPQIHRSQAIGLLNLTSNDWHRDAFASAGLESLRWPEIADETRPVGVSHCFGRPLTCYPAIGDQQAALLGCGLQPHELSINCSTGSQVSQIMATFQPGECQTRSWFGGQFLNTVTNIPAGRSLTVLESLLTELSRAAGQTIENSWSLILSAVERCDATGQSVANGLACDLSFFDSATGREGSLTGITTENLSVGNLFLATFECMADSYLACSRRLSNQPTWSSVAVTGGLVQSFPALRRRLQKKFLLPFREVAEQEETLVGLMTLARGL